MRCPICGSGLLRDVSFSSPGASYARARCRRPYCPFETYLRTEECTKLEFDLGRRDYAKNQPTKEPFVDWQPSITGFRGQFLLFVRSIIFRLEKRWRMSGGVMENVSCPYCKSSQVRITDTKYRGQLTVRYFICRHCGQTFRVNGNPALGHILHCRVKKG